MTLQIVLWGLGAAFAAGAVIALLVYAAVCPDRLWNLPPFRAEPPRKPRARNRDGEPIDLVEWRPRHWR